MPAADRRRAVRGSSSAFAVLDGEVPGQRADARQQDHEADQRPDDDRAGRAVVDQRLGRPVVGVGDLAAGPVGRSSPGRPEEEGVQSAASVAGRGSRSPGWRRRRAACRPPDRRRRGRCSARRPLAIASGPQRARRPGRPSPGRRCCVRSSSFSARLQRRLVLVRQLTRRSWPCSAWAQWSSSQVASR